MVGGQLWNAKQDEERAKALVKEDLAVAVHQDASLLKSLPNSMRSTLASSSCCKKSCKQRWR